MSEPTLRSSSPTIGITTPNGDTNQPVKDQKTPKPLSSSGGYPIANKLPEKTGGSQSSKTSFVGAEKQEPVINGDSKTGKSTKTDKSGSDTGTVSKDTTTVTTKTDDNGTVAKDSVKTEDKKLDPKELADEIGKLKDLAKASATPNGKRAEATRQLREAQISLRPQISKELSRLETELSKPNLGQKERENLTAARHEMLKLSVQLELPHLGSDVPYLDFKNKAVSKDGKQINLVDTLASELGKMRDKLDKLDNKDLKALVPSDLLESLGRLPMFKELNDKAATPKGERAASELLGALSGLVMAMVNDDEAVALNALNGTRLPKGTPVGDIAVALQKNEYEKRAAFSFVNNLRTEPGATKDDPRVDTAFGKKIAKDFKPDMKPGELKSLVQKYGTKEQVKDFETHVGKAGDLASLKYEIAEQEGRMARAFKSDDRGSQVVGLIRQAMSGVMRGAFDGESWKFDGGTTLLTKDEMKLLAKNLDGEGAFQVLRYAELLDKFQTLESELTGFSSQQKHEDFRSEMLEPLLSLKAKDFEKMGYSPDEVNTSEKLKDIAKKLGDNNFIDAGHAKESLERVGSAAKEGLTNINNQKALHKENMGNPKNAVIEMTSQLYLKAFKTKNPLADNVPTDPNTLRAGLKEQVINLQNAIVMNLDERMAAPGSLSSKELTKFGNEREDRRKLLREAAKEYHQMQRDQHSVDLGLSRVKKQKQEAIEQIKTSNWGDPGHADKPNGLAVAKQIKDASQLFANWNPKDEITPKMQEALDGFKDLSSKRLARAFGNDEATLKEIKKNGPTPDQVLNALKSAEAVIMLREHLPTEKSILKEEKKALDMLEISRDRRLGIGGEGSFTTFMKRLFTGKLEWNTDALKSSRTTVFDDKSKMRLSFELNRPAHDTLDRVIRMVAAEVMLDKTNKGDLSTPFEPKNHRAEIETKLRALGLDTELFDLNISQVLEKPMTAKSLQKYALAEQNTDDFRLALNTDPGPGNKQYYQELWKNTLHPSHIRKAVAQHFTQSDKMQQQMLDGLKTVLDDMKPGESIDFRSGKELSAKWKQKLDPALMSSIELRLMGQMNRDIVITKTKDGFEVTGLKGFHVGLGATGTVGFDLNSFSEQAGKFRDVGFVLESNITAKLGVEGGRATGYKLTLNDNNGRNGRDALMSLLDHASQGDMPDKLLLENTEDSMKIIRWQGDVEGSLSAASRVGFRAVKDREEMRTGGAKDQAGGLQVGIKATGELEVGGSKEEGTSLDRGYVMKEWHWEGSFKGEIDTLVDLRAISTFAGKEAEQSALADWYQKKDPSLDRGKALELATSLMGKASGSLTGEEKGILFGTGIVNVIVKTLGNSVDTVSQELINTLLSKALNDGKIFQDGALKISKDGIHRTIVEYNRSGSAQDKGANIVTNAVKTSQITVGGAAQFADSLKTLLGEEGLKRLTTDKGLQKEYHAMWKQALEDPSLTLEVSRELKPQAKSLVQGLSRDYETALELGDDGYAKELEAQIKTIVSEDSSFEVKGVTLLRKVDTSGTAGVVPLSVINYGVTHGLIREEQMKEIRI